MRYKTLFRLLCKLLGLYFIVQAVSGVIQMITALITYFFTTDTASSSWSLNYLVPSMAATLWGIGAGCYLFFRGERIINLAIPSNRPYCPSCGYEMSGAPTAVCPECGVHQQKGSPESRGS